MTAALTWRTVWAVCMLSMLLTSAVSQIVVPSNSTLPSSEHMYALQVSPIQSFTVFPLTGNAQLGSVLFTISL